MSENKKDTSAGTEVEKKQINLDENDEIRLKLPISQLLSLNKTISQTCILLSDALEIRLREIHNNKDVVVDKDCIELATVTEKFIRLYLETSK
ncbi:hypothetical protein H1D32_13140 [Anaerobacillus sp. CMMVII]|uniref:hypothetical protein n=1 Tax=Anaerobacillus sp. CMMVII TaxID=2755588 RepID=UPI0021B719DA|nr:hypothetical protein [Anaerobacillus sp. CMMVII]MCT8138601.1 hypothetical protein [Anaerobacillus sp. CMMVII]